MQYHPNKCKNGCNSDPCGRNKNHPIGINHAVHGYFTSVRGFEVYTSNIALNFAARSLAMLGMTNCEIYKMCVFPFQHLVPFG